MCVVSMVHDFYSPRFDPWFRPPIQPLDTEQAAVIIKNYREAMEAARKVDALTEQPDCEDPTKATLVERVAQLEKRIAELERQVGG